MTKKKDLLTGEAYFDRFAQKGYDALMKEAGYRAPEVVFQAVCERVSGQEHISILDVGIGTGNLSSLFREQFNKNACIAGVDISQKMLDNASRKKIADRLARADISKDPLPFRDNRFDVSVSCGVFEFLSDLKHVFNEMARVTKPDGLVVVACEAQGSPLPATGNIDVTDRTGLLTEEWRVPKSWFPGERKVGVHYHSSRSVTNAMKAAGIEPLSQKPFVAYEDSRTNSNFIYRLYIGRKPPAVKSP